MKVEGLPDLPVDDDGRAPHEMDIERTSMLPMWDQPGVHEVYRRWRTVTDEYAVEGADADRILCAEAWVKPDDAMAAYVRPDELHQAFNFNFLVTPWIAEELRGSITRSLAAVAPFGSPQTPC